MTTPPPRPRDRRTHADTVADSLDILNICRVSRRGVTVRDLLRRLYNEGHGGKHQRSMYRDLARLELIGAVDIVEGSFPRRYVLSVVHESMISRRYSGEMR